MNIYSINGDSCIKNNVGLIPHSDASCKAFSKTKLPAQLISRLMITEPHNSSSVLFFKSPKLICLKQFITSTPLKSMSDPYGSKSYAPRHHVAR